MEGATNSVGQHQDLRLYTYIESLPIIDYHCHLEPKFLVENKPFKSIADAMLSGDHYKWRLMRSCGYSESFCAGGSLQFDQFFAWAKTLERSVGNQVAVWNAMELDRFFSVDIPLNSQNAKEIWAHCQQLIETPDFLPLALLERLNVEILATTDDPTDDLVWHQRQDPSSTKIIPTFRPDKLFRIENNSEFLRWLSRLSDVSGVKIRNLESLKFAITQRFEFFVSVGCRLSDHGLDGFWFEEVGDRCVENLLQNLLTGKSPTEQSDLKKWFSYWMVFFAKLNSSFGNTMLLHIGAARNLNRVEHANLGSDKGFDAIGEESYLSNLGRYFSCLQSSGELPKTIIFNSNPKDTVPLVTLAGCFQREQVSSLIEVGPPWWFLDHEAGIRDQLQAVATNGVLANMTGMVTDSRSLLSFVRHDFFRRIASRFVEDFYAESIVKPTIHDDEALIGCLKDISYFNARRLLGEGDA